MRAIPELLLKALLVTITIGLCFAIGNVLDLPAWLQVFFLIPVGYLFLRLAAEEIPPASIWLPYLLALTLLVGLFVGGVSLLRNRFPQLDEGWYTFLFALFVLLAPQRPVANWLRRPWPRKGEPVSTPDAPAKSD